MVLAMILVAGIVGRAVTLRRAQESEDVETAARFTEAAHPFERMVVTSSMLILPAGLLTAWAQGYEWLGLTTGWMLVSTLIYVAASALVPTVFLPRGRAFEAAMADARGAGSVTPQLREAFRDPQVRAARAFEIGGIAVIVALMVLKPF
ncbi:MAG: DUF2269 domain-containing protein [Chloroflexota bacterium]|nr:DUF2269 domain-containing protein [Chloroflexota bacterium]